MFLRRRILPKEEGNLYSEYEVWNDLKVVQLDLKDLWTFFPLVEKTKNEKYGVKGEDFFDPLKNDIKEKGMINPVVVIPITKELTDRWEGNFAMWLYRHPIDWESKDVQMAVFTGNNRYHVAEQLGYTSIDCVILKENDMVSAARIQDPINSTREYKEKNQC
mgnify:CR=1 FL=1|jgi:hypothetical protein